MPLNIIILEDNAERRAAMQDCIQDRFHQYPIQFFSDAPALIAYLQTHLTDTLILSLDHDLELPAQANGKTVDPGTGRDVADFLATQAPACPVIIHTTNLAAAQSMEMMLQGQGWVTLCVVPFDDLTWITTDWFPVLRKAILQRAKPLTPTAREGALRPLTLPHGRG